MEAPKPSQPKKPAGKKGFVDQSARRDWDVEKYAQLAADREIREREEQMRKELGPHAFHPLKPRDPLQPREFELDLAQRLGRREVVTASTAAAESGGYYCKVCDCLIKDSQNYLDHLNGKKHQRALGMSMRVVKSSVESVRARLHAHKKTKPNERAPVNAENTKLSDFESRVERIRQEESRRKEVKRDRRRAAADTVDKAQEAEEGEKRARTSAEQEELDQLAAMGLPTGFGSS
eukprot:gnl/Trimastix_PCT/2899.p5 GENE.gnl/Trimastix_PCT/2899~~gnl/Trimastix_PCT/2899.p5  ORF type:complete len:234 (+),score=56.62 gnl/Trimastix_PCT/2899:1280-1981(+)